MSATIDAPLHILLVEDNPNDALLIRRHLEGAESAFLPETVKLTHVESLDAAVETLEASGIDLVLLDLGLPESSGAETFQRASERLPALPVVVLTNLRDEETAVDLLQAGAQDYINKGSLSEEQLVKSVRYAMERQEREQQLKTTSEQLEVLNRILRHDIQNDVQILQLWSESLLEDVADEYRDDIQKIRETSDHIGELTENSKSFIEMVTGDRELEAEPTRLDRIVREELQKARSGYENATFDVVEGLTESTVAANGMLSSVFRNLLNNAVQHNPGGCHVEITLTVSDDTAKVTVTDNGSGVPDERKEEIFGKGEHGLDSEGTGIGLYLANTLVTEFGGEIWVEDRQDGESGAVFVVELPTVEAETEWL